MFFADPSVRLHAPVILPSQKYVLTTSTASEVETAHKKEKPHWDYFLLLPGILTAIFVAFIVCFYEKHAELWSLPHEQYLSGNDCGPSYTGLFERSFVLDKTYGHCSFATAKIIDTVWDAVVAQGGRLLHVYIFYRHVARKVLVCIMERSSVTYDDYISIVFSQSFPNSMWFAVRRMFKTKQIALWLCFAGMAYMLVYASLFSMIWSTATGYISPGQRTYRMPDGTYVPIDTPHLALCWSVDSERLGLPPGHVEMGPDFSALQPWLSKSTTEGKWMGWDQIVGNDVPDTSKGGEGRFLQSRGIPDPSVGANRDYSFNDWARTIWDDIGPAGMGLSTPVSETFQDIFSYAFTSRMFQTVFNITALNETDYDTEISLPVSERSANVSLVYNGVHPEIVVGVNLLNSLSTQVNFLQFAYTEGLTSPTNKGLSPKFFNTWPMLTYATHHKLDKSLRPGPSIVPYNSTFVFNGTEHAVEAPFVDIGHHCSHPFNYFTALGNCVCYNGVPLEVDWYRDENIVCLDSPMYVWGFSSYIIYVGLICELVWILLALWIRGSCKWSSGMLKHPRVSKADVICSVLELAEAMCGDLDGERSSLDSEKVLKKRLRAGDDIAYAADYGSDGELHSVKIVSRPRKPPPVDVKL